MVHHNWESHVELKRTLEAWRNLLKLNLQLDRNGRQASSGVINFCQMSQLLSQNWQRSATSHLSVHSRSFSAINFKKNRHTMVLKATLNGLLLFWLMISTQLISTLTTARFIYNIPSDTKSLSDRTFEKRLPTQLYFDPLGGMALGKRAGPSAISGQYFDPLAGMAFGKRAGLIRPTWNAGFPEPAY
ncbi:Baccatin III:3-amino-3-phenylpropanoyltransferase [Trichinella spiralis]|uniref:Baccatin III:3-amino-3-phenylpropanoyltransferase n=1 Tax=Trichinella spiralis TaxID=6334 RepID=A0ABR3KKY9_TRISP